MLYNKAIIHRIEHKSNSCVCLCVFVITTNDISIAIFECDRIDYGMKKEIKSIIWKQ